MTRVGVLGFSLGDYEIDRHCTFHGPINDAFHGNFPGFSVGCKKVAGYMLRHGTY